MKDAEMTVLQRKVFACPQNRYATRNAAPTRKASALALERPDLQALTPAVRAVFVLLCSFMCSFFGAHSFAVTTFKTTTRIRSYLLPPVASICEVLACNKSRQKKPEETSWLCTSCTYPYYFSLLAYF